MTNSRGLAVAAVLAGACIIGTVPILVRLTETGPAAAGFWRMLLAVPMLLPFLWRKSDRPTPSTALPDWALIGAGLFFAGDLAFWHYGIGFTSIANATVLANLTPIVVTLVAWLLYREKPAGLFLAGMLLGMGGAWMLAEARTSGHAPGANPPLGDLLSAITALWYAGYFITGRKAREQRGVVAVMFWSSAVSALALGVVMLVLREQVMPASAAGWWACIGLAVAHVTGQGAIAWALGRLPTATASVVVLVQPAVAALLGWMIFSEAMTPLQGLGALAALAGVALAQWAAARDQKKADLEA
jgi:drug/metabolite transporter (DMT)-like permease